MVERFTAAFGREPEVVTRAPGRINLIGEHTDYNDGFVLPLAIQQSVWVAIAPRSEHQVNAVAETTGEQTSWSRGEPVVERLPPWARYVRPP